MHCLSACPPLAIANAVGEHTKPLPVGSIVDVECEEGFEHFGASPLYCQLGGVWSGTVDCRVRI